MRQFEALHGLSHEASFDLLSSTRSRATPRDKNEWKTFVKEVWDRGIDDSGQSHSMTATELNRCPECQSDSIDSKTEFRPDKKAQMAGQLAFGIVGQIAAGAALGRRVEQCECRSCGHKWERDIGSSGKAAIGSPDHNSAPPSAG